jgi:hypothetical protein
VRIDGRARGEVLHLECGACPPPAAHLRGRRLPIRGVLVLDLIFVAAIIAVFVVVGLIAKGVEKL